MTVNDLIRRAMRSLGVLHTGENPSAAEAADALDTLNDLLNAWRNEGLDLEVVSDLALTDTLPYPDDHVTAIRYNLAVELAPEYGVQVSQVVAAMARRHWLALRAQYMRPDTLSTPDDLLPVYNPITNDGFYKEI